MSEVIIPGSQGMAEVEANKAKMMRGRVWLDCDAGGLGCV